MSLFKDNDLHYRLRLTESMFNHVYNWPIMELVVDTIKKHGTGQDSECNLLFVSGEYILSSSEEEFKADAIIIDTTNEDEIMLLETSGKAFLVDNSRFGYDHIKGAFGALSILNSIMKKYYNANIASAIKLRIPFLHTRGK